MLLPCSAVQYPPLPTPLKRYSKSFYGSLVPPHLPRMWPLCLHPLCHPLALQKQLPTGFSKNLPDFQMLEGERGAQLVKTQLAFRCHQIGLLGRAEVLTGTL